MPGQNLVLRDLPEFLEGDRIILRCPKAGDGAVVFEAVDESRDTIYPWLPWTDKHDTPNDSEEFARRAAIRWMTREDLTMAIWHKESGRYLGGTGLHRINWETPSFEIGYWIRKSEEGKGYITEAVRVLAKFVFEELHAQRLFIRCSHENMRSRAVPSRLGFVCEGTMRNEIRLADGKLSDIVVYSMTPEDWHNRSW